jgi:RecA/RadA recombinase
MAKPKQSKSEGGFDIFNRGASFVTAVKEGLCKSAAAVASDSADYYGIMPSNTTGIIPFTEFSLQWLFKSRGMIGGRIVDIIGTDGVGKTTLLFTLAGQALRHNCPTFIVQTEGKSLDPARIKRCLHTDPLMAERMLPLIHTEESFTLMDAVNRIDRWIQYIRNPKSGDAYVPREVPCLVGLDTFSKLMAPAEAVGYDYYSTSKPSEDLDDKADESKNGQKPGQKTDQNKGKKTKAKKAKNAPPKEILELDARGQFGHSSIAHRWSRRLAGLLTYGNCVLVLIRHQNDKVEMSAGGGSFVSQEVKDAMNRTSIGGNAFNQSTSFQFVVSRDKAEYGTVAGERRKTAQRARIKLVKSSYGPDSHSLVYGIVQQHRRDTDTFKEQALDFSPMIGDIVKDIGFSVNKKNEGSFAVKELKLDDASPQEILQALNSRPDMIEEIGERLEWVGFAKRPRKVAELHPMFRNPELNADGKKEVEKDED